jgi:hypothetical protein|tara:strand:+ start:892 stop:1161 length:270 start_codon:yes stop_codon:yes gene_type:complete
MSKEKIYVGNGTEKFDGDLVEFSVNLSKLNGDAKQHIYEYNGEKYIKLKVAKKKGGADEYGKTHYVEVDTWKPTEKKAVAEPVDDGLPF